MRARFALILLPLIAAPAAEAQPALGPLKPCYVSVQTAPGTFETEAIGLSGTGFDPGSAVDFSVDGDIAVAGLIADRGGNVGPATAKAPVVRSGQRTFTVAASDREYHLVTATTKVSALTVSVSPSGARPTQKVRFRGRGFTDRAGIYVHYIRRGKLRRTVRLIRRPVGDCGTFSVRARQFPFTPARGVWLVQIDQHKTLGTRGPLVRLSVDVSRQPKTG